MKEKVLMIEDDADYRVILNERLSEYFEVVEAATLAAGVQQALGQDFFCILLDLNLPDSKWPDTFNTFAQITRAAAVIIVSGSQDPEMIGASIRQGAAGYLVKGRDDRSGDYMFHAICRAVLHKKTELGLDQAAQIAHETTVLTRAGGGAAGGEIPRGGAC